MILLMKPRISLPYSDNFTAYSLGVSTSLDSINQKLNVMDLEPGLHTVVSVTPQFIQTTEEFNELPYYSRRCKLPHETINLKSFKNYSRTACEHECAFMKAVSACKCTPWYYRNNFTAVPICEKFGGLCFDNVMSTRKFYKQCSDYCLEDCNGMQLSWEKSFRPINIDKICKRGSVLQKYLMESAKQHFSDDHYNRLTTGDKEKVVQQFIYLDMTMRNGNISDHYVTLCKDFVKKYVAVVTVETPTNVITKISRDLSATLFEIMGILGGQIGLFTGFSMLSILECMRAIHNFIWHYGEGTGANEKIKTETKRKRQGESNSKNVFDKSSHQRRFDCIEKDVEILKKEMNALRKVCENSA